MRKGGVEAIRAPEGIIRRPAALHCVHLAFSGPVVPLQLLLYGLTL